MKASEAPEKLDAGLTETDAVAHAGQGTNWMSLAWLAVLVAVGLAAAQRLEHYLFPQLHSAQHQALNVCVGTIAAVVGTYYSTRKFNRALALHAQVEKKLALERN